MPRVVILLMLLALVLAGPATAQGGILFSATLTTDQEPPPPVRIPTDTLGNPRPTPFGFATLFLNDEQTALAYSITVFNIDFTGSQTPDINDNLVAAHFHRAPPGVNGPVIFGFIGTPFNETNPNDVVVTPFTTGVGGTVTGKWDLPEGNNTTLGAEINNLLSGNTYANFHTLQFRGGEIRGQILMPEPTTLTLVLLGGLGLAGARLVRRRRRSA